MQIGRTKGLMDICEEWRLQHTELCGIGGRCMISAVAMGRMQQNVADGNDGEAENLGADIANVATHFN